MIAKSFAGLFKGRGLPKDGLFAGIEAANSPSYSGFALEKTACRAGRQAVFSVPRNEKNAFPSGRFCAMLSVTERSAAFKRRSLPRTLWTRRRCTDLYSRAALETGRLSVFEEKARRGAGPSLPATGRVLRLQSTLFFLNRYQKLKERNRRCIFPKNCSF